MMRYLPKRFRTKVIIIGESKDFDTIKVDAFVGSLQNLYYPYFILVGTNPWI